MAPEVDWSLPWFAPWREPGGAVAHRAGSGVPLHDALNAHPGAALRFVPQGELPDGMPYEAFIHDSGLCPVRDNLHDFFNGLCWLKFPLAKRQLNRLQAGEIARHGIAGRRGPVRDAITVFDENGALLQAPPDLWEALLARDWRRLFVTLRPQWRCARLLVFGHALLEKLATAPRKDLTAHVWGFPVALDPAAALDATLARAFSAEALAAKPFTPLPVLGVPGWWGQNENFSFYDDSLVFRPRRTPSATTT
jgi:hypothetical protein